MNDMPADERKPATRLEWLTAAALIVAGAAIAALSVVEIRSNERHQQRIAQADPAPQSSPSEKKDAPAESKPGGTRPTTPAPEPARPDPDALKAGAQPALPPAPAEKMGPPIREK